mgnify:CR=1 FL=1
MCAIHAIELYLSALLLRRGTSADDIRTLQHSLRDRAARAARFGINLRANTLEHIQALDQNREYLITRYGPEMLPTVSQINRLTATLDEVARKVSQLLAVDAPKAGSSAKAR